MTDRTLLDGSREPAHVDGYGPVPAAWAREDGTCRTPWCDAPVRGAPGGVRLQPRRLSASGPTVPP